MSVNKVYGCWVVHGRQPTVIKEKESQQQAVFYEWLMWDPESNV